MLLRRPPQRTRTAKESGQNETKKQSTTATTTTEIITFQFEAKLYPLGALTEMPMLRLRPLPKPKRRPMLPLLLMMLRRTLEQSVRAKNRTQKTKKPNRQRSIQFFSFFLFCFVGRRVLGIAIKKSENSNNAKSLTHTHRHTHTQRENQRDSRTDSIN